MKLDFKKIDIKFVGISFVAILLLCFLSYTFINTNPYNRESLPIDYEANFSKLVINEVVNNNDGVYANSNNEVCDYIEIFNSSNKEINLFGYGLSDDDTKIKWAFPNIDLEANSYLVVSCVGKDDGYLSASFKLSSSNSERIILTNPNGKIIDAVDTVSLSSGECLARDNNGNLKIYDYCTPGYENSLNGYSSYKQSLITQISSDLIINEFLARNKGNYLSNNDKGFIEFKNNSNQTIRLNDYFISGDLDVPFKQQLPNVILNPNEICAFNLGNGKDSIGINLDSKSGNIVLSKQGKIVSVLEYSNLPNGNSYKYNDGFYYYSIDLSFNEENDSEGVANFYNKNVSNSELVINEVMNNNFSYLPSNTNEYFDFIELYNKSDNDIDLSDYYLSDSDSNLKMYKLPDVVLKANDYYVLLCSGNELLTNDEYYHTNFKISEDTGLYLSKGDKIVDCIHVGNIPLGYSYGRNNGIGCYYLKEPTPNQKNCNGYVTMSATPNVDLDSGIYNDVENVVVNINCANDIYYTLDGNDPTIYSHKYTEPITLNKTTLLKVRSINENSEPSEVVVRSYIINENHTLPIISIAINRNDFNSINANYRLHDYAKNAYVEYFDSDNGFKSKCGLSLYGDESRTYLKKNYLFRFDSEYGASDLFYKVFDDRDYIRFDSLTIRAGGQDWNKGIINDSLCTTLIDDCTDVPTYTSKSVIAYINGEYWGLYSLREKKSHGYIRSLYDINSDTVNLRMANGETEWGDSSEYDELVNFCNNNDLSIKENYDYVVSKLDLNEWVDFWIGQMYTANIDFFNLRYFNSDELDDGKWKAIFYDLDFALDNYAYNSYTNAFCMWDGFHCHWANAQGPQNRIENVIIKNLFKNDEFKKLWLEKLNDNLRTTWKKDRVMDRFNQLVSEFEPEIARDRNRWGIALSVYNESINHIKTFIENRERYVLSTTKSYFKLSDEQMKEIFGDLYA